MSSDLIDIAEEKIRINESKVSLMINTKMSSAGDPPEFLIENWRPIVIKDCPYEVSDWGRVRNKNDKILRGGNSHGYRTVSLRSGSDKRRHFLVHRLVAEAFIPNPKNLPCVNHKDGNRANNNVENLEWVTKSENSFHAVNVLGKTRKCKPIIQYSEDSDFITRFDNGKIAEETTGVKRKTIWANCNGTTTLGGGFLWKWETEIDHDVNLKSFVDVPGFNQYMVSQEGEIYSKTQRKIMNKRLDGSGYERISIRKDNKAYPFGVHEVVALAYIPDPDNLPIINHKDHNKSNNHVDNLERTTLSGNAKAAVAAGKIKTKPVQKFSLDGKLLGKYPSIEEASRQNNALSGCTISMSCKNPGHLAGGFVWCFEGADLTDRFVATVELTLPHKGRERKVSQYNRDGSLVITHSTMIDATKSIKDGKDGGIRRCCQGRTSLYKGFIWRYA